MEENPRISKSNKRSTSRRQTEPHFRLRDLAIELIPNWKLRNQWCCWPPDIFALTSIALRSTGLYRLTVTPASKDKTTRLDLEAGCPQGKGKTPFPHDREKFIEDQADRWREWVAEGCPTEKKPDFLDHLIKKVERMPLFYHEDEVERHRGGADVLYSQQCAALINLHALADCASVGFGLAIAKSGTEYVDRVVGLWANLLVEHTGSLSRLPKRHGLVLPRMRTPQGGLTLRSFSHHLTFHQSEVDIRWRMLPWVNREDSAMNIMAVPMPYMIGANDFKPFRFDDGMVFPGQDTDVGDARYFDFAPSQRLDTGLVINLLRKAQSEEVSRVHLLVFPELALTEADFKALKNAITKEFRGEETKIPMIVAGVGGRHKNRPAGKLGLGFNKVVLSFFFANKWYDLEQDKHHRWKLEQTQIRQYSIAAVLNSRYKWWEGIHVPRRRLNFVCPNNWLTLCPLICEDLAQLEPVSTLIRGVGPTLVIAILLDGPQITERWSARYVGVLADDPGTSILTVTSLGMARRARDKGKPENRNVILWKDQINGWEPIELKEGKHAVILSVVAEFREEFTADRRSDHRNAPVLVLQGWKTIMADGESPESRNTPIEEERSRLVEQYDLKFPDIEKWDIEEVSIAEYLIDAMLDLDPKKFVARFSKMIETQTITADANGMSNRQLKRVAKLWDIIKEASDFSRKAAPVSEFDSISEEEDFPLSGQIPRQVLRDLFRLLSKERIFYEDPSPDEHEKNLLWEKTIDLIRAQLQHSVDRLKEERIQFATSPTSSPQEKEAEWEFSSELHRVTHLVYLSVLWATYNRIAGEIAAASHHARYKLDSEVLGEFRKKLRRIDDVMKEHIMHESLYSSPLTDAQNKK